MLGNYRRRSPCVVGDTIAVGRHLAESDVTMVPIFELHNGVARLRVAPSLGARVTRCVLEGLGGAGIDILHPYPEQWTNLDDWAKGGIYPLIPYSGRIAQARLYVEERVWTLKSHPNAEPHSLHGNAHRCSWAVESRSDNTLQLRLDHAGDGDWPWPYRAYLRLKLDRRRLRIDVDLVNRSDTDMPSGIGLHPYLCCTADTLMQTRASHRWLSTPDHVPIACRAVDGPYDLESPHALGDTDQTVFWSGWSREAWLRFGNKYGLVMRASETLNHLVLHRPAAAPYVCLEPQSHVPDAFNLAWRGAANTGTVILPPGGKLAGRVSFELSGSDSPMTPP